MANNIAVISICSVLLVAVVVAVTVGVNHSGKSDGDSGEVKSASKAIKELCQPTDYQHSCENSLSNANTTDPKELIRMGFQAAMTEIETVIANSTTLKELVKGRPRAKQALENCHELMGYAIDDLNNSFKQLGEFDVDKYEEYVENLKIWLAGSITYQQTCLDGFIKTRGESGEKMRALLKTAQELSSNALAMVSELDLSLKKLHLSGATQGVVRRLLSHDQGGFPSWVSSTQRKLLENSSKFDLKPNVVVAKDKSGKYGTINDALKEIPKRGSTPFVIYIKKGVYKEQVIVTKEMKNVVFIGDGPEKTIITGKLNYVDGVNTFRTATVAVIGEKFMAKNIGILNTAGAKKHQAVALRVQSDQSIFYHCKIAGYQDTLYVHSHRQFYRECIISGTIDFIFGDAAAVLQNCRIIVRKPMSNQKCIVTAQGRSERREVTGMVIHNCTFTGEPKYMSVKNKNKAYLGRPWKEFSRTIIMQSHIDDIIAPEGWLPWNGNFALDTLVYSEFNNRGPGADTSKRVKWRGLKTFNEEHAKLYTPHDFLHADEWISRSGVPYTPGMMPGL
ncbi:hypothetical protein J1N35_037158 [Gossypium stocksii]|uniref:Pectinesterase n=1 Tax=Gossypium stocksii TaxID=47602 RepID=A0A9D3UK79_9ROSI|nr:hypothetical protein J1N35_037158 [Gossypium stocksii]